MATYAERTRAPGAKARDIRRVVAASMFGTTLEWYDFFIYTSAAALVFPTLFFPEQEPLTATLLSFLTYSVGFVARPVGAVVFGHFGDIVGRKNMLVLTLIVMGAATFLIGILPTYGSIGLWAALLLTGLRFIQGLGLGGEWGGAVLMASEHARGRRGFWASWPQVGVPAGLLLATGAFSLLDNLLSEDAFFSWGWRIPFLLSAILILTGIWIRLNIAETPLFEEVERTQTKARIPMVDVLRWYPRSVAIAVGARIGTDVAFYTFVLFILTYVTTVLELSRSLALNAVLVGAAFQLFLMPAFGALSDRFGRRPVYLLGAIAAAVWVFVFFPLLETKETFLIGVATVVALAFHALMYGPQASFIAELFGTRVRYSGASLGYQAAGVVGGAVAPIVSVWLLDRYDSWVPVAIYVLAMLAITIVSLVVAKETANVDLAETTPEERRLIEEAQEAAPARA